MSTMPSTTVSMAPDSTARRSSSMVSAGSALVMRRTSGSRRPHGHLNGLNTILKAGSGEQPTKELRRGVAVLLHHRPRRLGVAAKNGLNDAGVLRIGVIKVAAEHRNRQQ